jgi:PAS domain S-box-containing protein
LYRDITERKKTEETLRKSQQEFAALFNNSPDAALYHDKEGLILNVNPRFTELFGHTLEELKGKNINQGIIFPQDKTREESERLTKLALEGKVIEHETIRKKKDGTLVPVIISVSPVIIDGQSKGIIAFFQDITKQKNMLEKLKESEEKYRNLFENMPGAYYCTDKEGNLIMINPEGAKLFGYNSLEDILGKNIAQHLYFAPKERKKYLKELEKNKGNLKDFELNLKKRDGSPLVISDTSHYYYDKKGNIAGIEGIFMDITERKKMEENLRKSQQEFASLFKSSPDALVYLDEKANILDVNSRFTKLFGYTLEEVKGRNIDDGMIHPTDKIEEGKRLSKNGFEGRLNYETARKRKDGTLFPVHISSAPVIIKGEKKGFIAVYQDITERKKAEEDLRNNQQEFASLFSSTPEALVYLDKNSNILNINPRFAELFGYTLEEVKGRNLDDGMIHPPDKIEEGKRLTKKSLERHFYFETIRKKKDGTLFPVAISGSRVIIDGQLKGLIGVFQDITERKDMEWVF